MGNSSAIFSAELRKPGIPEAVRVGAGLAPGATEFETDFAGAGGVVASVCGEAWAAFVHLSQVQHEQHFLLNILPMPAPISLTLCTNAMVYMPGRQCQWQLQCSVCDFWW